MFVAQAAGIHLSFGQQLVMVFTLMLTSKDHDRDAEQEAHWGRHWMDVVRYGESNGYEQNHVRPSAWPYRDWVIRALNAALEATMFKDYVAASNGKLLSVWNSLCSNRHQLIAPSSCGARGSTRSWNTSPGRS